MSTKTTKCPKCETTFRVSDAQLQVAKGKVRCGSCLHVFRADEHWVGAATPAAASPAKPAAPAGKFSFDQSAIDSSSADKVLTQPVQAVNTIGEMKAVKATAKPVPAKKDLKDIDDDELISDDPDEDKPVADTAPAKAVTEDDYSDVFVNLDDLEGDGDQFNTTGFEAIEDQSLPGAGKKPAAGSADESWAKDILDEIQDDSADKEAHMKALFSGQTSKDSVFADNAPKKKREGPRDGFISGNRTEAPDHDDVLSLFKPSAPAPVHHMPLSRTEVLSKIEPPPVEISWNVSREEWLGVVVWGGLCLVAALTLFIQYAAMVFDQKAREQAYRPYYAAACSLIGCELPDIYNPAAIRSTNMVVRDNPSNSNILLVDIVLINTADYEQPFPVLELYFSDVDNFPVASRRFLPREYLAGEMAGKKMMPVQKAVHISLELVHPGEKAVGYSVQVSNRNPVNS